MQIHLNGEVKGSAVTIVQNHVRLIVQQEVKLESHLHFYGFTVEQIGPEMPRLYSIERSLLPRGKLRSGLEDASRERARQLWSNRKSL